jgi:hypothetical protein
MLIGSVVQFISYYVFCVSFTSTYTKTSLALQSVSKSYHHALRKDLPTFINKHPLFFSSSHFDDKSENGAGYKDLIAKSAESFKLSDLYMMEANLESHARAWNQSKSLLMDQNTGSCLFTLDQRFLSNTHDHDNNHEKSNNCHNNIPSIIHRCDWICEKLAFGHNVIDFLHDIEYQLESNWYRSNNNINLHNYSLDYICMGNRRKNKNNDVNDGPTGDYQDNDYTSKSLTYRVVQLLSPAKCALNPQMASVELLIIDTPIGIFLGLKQEFKSNQKANNDTLLKKWSSRPFQYSSAINPMIALITVDLIKDLVLQEKKRLRIGMEGDNERTSMIDVTCGSGTFLAISLDRDMNVFGFDVNDKCVSGSNKNLEFLFGKDIVKDRARVQVNDSSSSNSNETLDRNLVFDCTISNMPWGQNTNMTLEENKVRDIYSNPNYIF